MPVAKQVILHVRAAEMERVARHVMRLATVDEIERYVLSSLGDVTTFGQGVAPE